MCCLRTLLSIFHPDQSNTFQISSSLFSLLFIIQLSTNLISQSCFHQVLTPLQVLVCLQLTQLNSNKYFSLKYSFFASHFYSISFSILSHGLLCFPSGQISSLSYCVSFLFNYQKSIFSFFINRFKSSVTSLTRRAYSERRC